MTTPELASQEKIDAALATEYGDLSPERKQILLLTVRSCRPEKRAAMHKIFIENLTSDELSFYNAITVVPPDVTPAPTAEPGAPAPSPEAAATKVTEGARAAEAKATGRGKKA